MYAYHGVYAEERILGSSYLVNIKVGIQEKKEIVDLKDTINYEVLLRTVKKYMQEPTALLEVIVQRIESEIHAQFQEIDYFYLSIRKLNPPLEIPTGGSEIILEKKYTGN